MKFDEFARKAATDMQNKARHAPIPEFEERPARSRFSTGILAATAVAASVIALIWVGTLVFDGGPEVVSPTVPITETIAPPAVTPATVPGDIAPTGFTTAEEAIAGYLADRGVAYLGACGQAPAGAIGYCSVDNGDGTFSVGPVASEFDASLALAQADDGSWTVTSAEQIVAAEEPTPTTTTSIVASPTLPEFLALPSDGVPLEDGTTIHPSVAFGFADGAIVYQEPGDSPILYRPAGPNEPVVAVPYSDDAVPVLKSIGVVDGLPTAFYTLSTPAVLEGIESRLETLHYVDLSGARTYEVATVAGYESGATTASYGSGVIAVGQVGEGLSDVLFFELDGHAVELPGAEGLACGMGCLDQPFISPDGATLAYLRTVDGTPQLVVVDLDTGEEAVWATLEDGATWLITDFDGSHVAVAAVAFDDQGEPSGWGAGQIVTPAGSTPLPDGVRATFLR